MLSGGGGVDDITLQTCFKLFLVLFLRYMGVVGGDPDIFRGLQANGILAGSFVLLNPLVK